MAKQIILTENQFNELFEVRYIDTKDSNGNKVRKKDYLQTSHQEPIKDSDVIRVFHGCSLRTAMEACVRGISGREFRGRTYSYENGMNPLGLFVTTDFYVAKNFGYSNEGVCVLEFSVRASDLESPIWNGQDTYFGQGSNPTSFRDSDEREAQKQAYRNKAASMEDDYFFDVHVNSDGQRVSKKIDLPKGYVRDSDKPEMAYNIFINNEHQALFMGDLNPNMIKRVWVNLPTVDDDGDRYIDSMANYMPMKRKDFVRKFWNEDFYINGSYNQRYEKIRNDKKLYLPNENIKSKDEVVERYLKKHGFGEGFEECKKNLTEFGFFDGERMLRMTSLEYIMELFWPRQIIQLYGKDFFDKYFNRLGQ